MNQIFNDVNLSISLLKLVGLFLALVGIVYLLTYQFSLLPKWKNILGLGFMFGLLNAGLIIYFGKIAFPVTLVLLIIFIGLFYFNKFPLYKVKHLLGLLISFILSSLTFFIFIAGTFFHLAVEVKKFDECFSLDFAFRLTEEEWTNLISQIVTSSLQHCGTKEVTSSHYGAGCGHASCRIMHCSKII